MTVFSLQFLVKFNGISSGFFNTLRLGIWRGVFALLDRSDRVPIKPSSPDANGTINYSLPHRGLRNICRRTFVLTRVGLDCTSKLDDHDRRTISTWSNQCVPLYQLPFLLCVILFPTLYKIDRYFFAFNRFWRIKLIISDFLVHAFYGAEFTHYNSVDRFYGKPSMNNLSISKL